MPELLDLRNINKSEEDVETADRVLNWKISGEIKTEQQTANRNLVFTVNAGLVLTGILYLVLQKNILSAVFFFLIALVSFILVSKEKKPVGWAVSPRGLEIENIFYPYNEIKSFWIEFNPPHLKELSFRFKKWYRPYVKIPLDREDPLVLRRYLTGFLREERHEDTLIETITRKLGV